MSWQSLLNTHTCTDDIYDIHAENHLANKVHIIPLSDYQLVVVSGEDSLAFLQGQCTCDFNKIALNQFIIGAHCTHKGRMNSSFHALQIDDQSIGLRVHRSIVQHTKDSLQKYAVFSKVTITIAQDYYLVATMGDHDQVLTKLGVTLPSIGEFTRSDPVIAARHQNDGVELWCHIRFLQSLLESSKEAVIHCTSNAWRLENIRQGIAEVEADTIEQLLPQELNFQLLDAISFNKGCYTGQEVVARLHYRGKLKKHVYRGYIESDHSPHVNDTIIDKSAEIKAKGRIVSVAKASHCAFEFLALCDDNLVTADSCVLRDHPCVNIQWKALPYAIN